MSEIIYTYNIDNPEIVIPYDRDEFYKEQIAENDKTWFPTKYVSIANALIINPNWELLLQQRSETCSSNPWLISKSVWWHIEYWCISDETIQKESVQEIWVPMLISRWGDFERNLMQMWKYINTIAIMKTLDVICTIVTKILNWKEYNFWIKEYSYIWVYWWEINFNDWEVSWLQKIELEELFIDIINNPGKYTKSFTQYILENKWDLELFIQRVKSILN